MTSHQSPSYRYRQAKIGVFCHLSFSSVQRQQLSRLYPQTVQSVGSFHISQILLLLLTGLDAREDVGTAV